MCMQTMSRSYSRDYYRDQLMSIVKPCVSRYTFAYEAESQITKTSLTRGTVRSIFKEAEDSVSYCGVSVPSTHLGIHLKSSTVQMKNVEFYKSTLSSQLPTYQFEKAYSCYRRHLTRYCFRQVLNTAIKCISKGFPLSLFNVLMEQRISL